MIGIDWGSLVTLFLIHLYKETTHTSDKRTDKQVLLLDKKEGNTRRTDCYVKILIFAIKFVKE